MYPRILAAALESFGAVIHRFLDVLFCVILRFSTGCRILFPPSQRGGGEDLSSPTHLRQRLPLGYAAREALLCYLESRRISR